MPLLLPAPGESYNNNKEGSSQQHSSARRHFTDNRSVKQTGLVEDQEHQTKSPKSSGVACMQYKNFLATEIQMTDRKESILAKAVSFALFCRESKKIAAFVSLLALHSLRRRCSSWFCRLLLLASF